MGCNCGKSSGVRAGRAVRTSGDYDGAGSYMTPTTPPEEPLAVLAVGDGPLPVPEGSRFKVTTAAEVAYFAAHGPAFGWQAGHGGKLRTV